MCESTIGLFKTEAINLTGPAWARRRMARRPLDPLSLTIGIVTGSTILREVRPMGPPCH